MKLPIMTRSLYATLESLEPSRRKHGLLTMESIGFQKDDIFGPRIEAIVSQYKDMVDHGANHNAVRKAVDLDKALTSLIKERLGLKVKLYTDRYLAAIAPNVYIPHNPVIERDIRELYEMLGENSEQKELSKIKHMESLGKVNLERAKVSGWFSDQELPLYINFVNLFRIFKASTAEVTAFILHELGHAFTAIILAANVNTTNQVIADITRHINDKKRQGDVDYIYAKIKIIDSKASRDIAEALASGNKVVTNVACYRLLMGTVKTLMNDSFYDQTTSESLADNFTARFNYGVPLVTGLEKLEDISSEYSDSKNVYEILSSAFIYSALITLVFGFLGVIIKGPKVVFFMLSVITGWFSFSVGDALRYSNSDMTYDNIKDRYIRVRNQLVEMIKDDGLSTETKTHILNQIKEMDLIIGNKKVFEGWITKISKSIFFPDARASETYMNQREIEQMLSNDIFVQANRLQVLGSK